MLVPVVSLARANRQRSAPVRASSATTLPSRVPTRRFPPTSTGKKSLVRSATDQASTGGPAGPGPGSTAELLASPRGNGTSASGGRPPGPPVSADAGGAVGGAARLAGAGVELAL